MPPSSQVQLKGTEARQKLATEMPMVPIITWLGVGVGVRLRLRLRLRFRFRG